MARPSDHGKRAALPPCPICDAPGKRIPYDGLRVFGAQCTACGWFYSRKRRA